MHGGRRVNAGRKTEITLMTQMSLALRVADLMRGEPGISRNGALRVLHQQKALPYGDDKSYCRYLTPGRLNPEIARVLSTAQREGIVTCIPLEILRYQSKK